MNFKLLDVIICLSIFQLIIFTIILISKGRSKISNIILASFFIAQILVIANWLLSRLGHNNEKFYLQIVLLTFPISFSWGPLIYFYVISQIKKDFKFRFVDIIHFLPVFLVITYIILIYYSKTYHTKIELIHSNKFYSQLNILRLILDTQILVYNIACLVALLKYQQNIKNYSSFEIKSNLNWLKFVIVGYIIFCLISDIFILGGKITGLSFELRSIIVFTSLLIFFNILFYKAMVKPYLFLQIEKPKYQFSSLSANDLNRYSEEIHELMIDKKPYLNPALTMKDISELSGISERIISQVINQIWKLNFYGFVNSYRIDEAKELLKNIDTEKTTMFAIACDSGFNSKSVFYKVFKNEVGMTPTDYRKSIKA